MIIRNVSTSVGDRFINLSFPSVPVVLLNGEYSAQIMLVMECLLANDYTGNYGASDAQYGYEYDALDGSAELSFATGAITGKSGAVKIEGNIPALHCIRCVGNSLLRSCAIGDSELKMAFNVDIFQDKNILTQGQMIRYCEIINRVLDYKAVGISNKGFVFSLEEKETCDLDTQKFICMLVGECMLTQKGYKRVVLFDYLVDAYKEVNVKLIEALASLSGHDAIFVGGTYLKPSDFKETLQASLLSC